MRTQEPLGNADRRLVHLVSGYECIFRVEEREMDEHRAPVVVVMADDDSDDVMFAGEALKKSQLLYDFRSVTDGAHLLDYLNHDGDFADASTPRPHLILLDLNMPRMHGLEVLAEIKKDPSLKAIPVVVLTTSLADEDIVRSYGLGAASFIQKPATFQGMVEAIGTLSKYWFETVALPVVR